MIRSFKAKETEMLWNRQYVRKFQAIERAARLKLVGLHAAISLEDLSLPGLRLEKLDGDRKGQYSIRINDQYRICFKWGGNDAFEVEVVDYH